MASPPRYHLCVGDKRDTDICFRIDVRAVVQRECTTDVAATLYERLRRQLVASRLWTAVFARDVTRPMVPLACEHKCEHRWRVTIVPYLMALMRFRSVQCADDDDTDPESGSFTVELGLVSPVGGATRLMAACDVLANPFGAHAHTFRFPGIADAQERVQSACALLRYIRHHCMHELHTRRLYVSVPRDAVPLHRALCHFEHMSVRAVGTHTVTFSRDRASRPHRALREARHMPWSAHVTLCARDECTKPGSEAHRCGMCDTVAYCSLECRHEAWRASHYRTCAKLRAAVACGVRSAYDEHVCVYVRARRRMRTRLATVSAAPTTSCE